MKSRQGDIFEFSIRSTVSDVLAGYNGTVFAYGQTGAGKSYTMMGDMEDVQNKGIIPRIVEQLFAAFQTAPQHMEFTVKVGYMEIYMERIRDLLNPQKDNLAIHEDKLHGVYVKDLTEAYANSAEEVYAYLQIGQRSRATAATNMNQESSRSHSVFVITISQKDTITGTQKSGVLYLVDLAGSEKVGKTGASGQTLEEAKKINKSLSALGMVINSLTDGKSSHIPYRDSKLTRILQESLGGNSRTTLIINCSPSSYNDAETVSTLRFGMRAKTIKNKAKINAELSPAELKRQLKSAQNQVLTFEKYMALLDGELRLWRNGETVPTEQWVAPMTGETAARDLKSSVPTTPSGLRMDAIRSETPSRPDSRIEDRSSTPSLIVEKDEREEFLRRENELQDQVAEKETQAANAEKSLAEVKEELTNLKNNMTRTARDNDSMAEQLNRAQMDLQKVSFQSKEDHITMDSLKEANSELEAELVSVKQQLLDMRMSAKETTAVLDEKDRKKQERMAKMIAGLDLGSEVFSDNERKIQDLIQQVDSLHETSSAGEAIAPDELRLIKAQLIESQGFIRQAELHMTDSSELNEFQDNKRIEIEEKLVEVQRSYEEILERKLQPSDVEEIKQRLSLSYSDRRDKQASLITDLRDELTHKSQELNQLRQSATKQQQSPPPPYQSNGLITNGTPTQSVAQQITEFDLMKKSLMRDLQNRCERVVELEISLDETREQYNNVLRSSNNRHQQKKMAFLERNLEQLTIVQRQLVEQNGNLKKEVAIAERKLIARNERIASLEALLGDSQDKLTAANHRFAPLDTPVNGRKGHANNTDRFEAQLQAVKERLEAAKVSARNLPTVGSPSGVVGNSIFSGAASRIAKPLRGGGGAAEAGISVNGGPSIPILSNLQAQDSSGGGGGYGGWGGGGGGASGGGKRSSWFFQNR
jgi:kinesin family member 5